MSTPPNSLRQQRHRSARRIQDPYRGQGLPCRFVGRRPEGLAVSHIHLIGVIAGLCALDIALFVMLATPPRRA
jgi:hypothetical protein